MRKILVPTDFSPTAERALIYALNLAALGNSSVILYHAFTPMGNAFIESGKAREDLNKAAEEDTLKKLQRLCKKHLGDREISVTTILGKSPIIDNILDFANEQSIDLIIMGTQGATGLKRVLVGSVAGRVIEKTKIPVIFIPEQYAVAATETVVFTTNNLKPDTRYIDIALEFAKLFQAPLKIVHLHTAYYDIEETQQKEIEFANFRNSLQVQLAYDDVQFRMINISSATTGMEELHLRIPYDLLVMVRRKRSFLEKLFLESFTKNMAYITTRPLLIIPEADK